MMDEAVRYDRLSVRLRRRELAALRSLPGESDSARVREAIVRATGAAFEDALARLAGRVVGEELTRVREAEREAIVAALADKLRPLVQEIAERLAALEHGQ